MVKAIAIALIATFVVLLSIGFSGINTHRAIGRTAVFLQSSEVLIVTGVLQFVIGVALVLVGKR